MNEIIILLLWLTTIIVYQLVFTGLKNRYNQSISGLIKFHGAVKDESDKAISELRQYFAKTEQEYKDKIKSLTIEISKLREGDDFKGETDTH